MFLSLSLSLFLSFFLSLSLSFFLSLYLSFFLSSCLYSLAFNTQRNPNPDPDLVGRVHEHMVLLGLDRLGDLRPLRRSRVDAGGVVRARVQQEDRARRRRVDVCEEAWSGLG